MLQIFGALFLLCVFIHFMIFLWEISPLIVLGLAGAIGYSFYKVKSEPLPTSLENMTEYQEANLYSACKYGDKSHPFYQKCKFCPRLKKCDASELKARVAKTIASLSEPPKPSRTRRRRKHSHSHGGNSSANNFSNNYYGSNYYGYDDGDLDYDADFDSDADDNDSDDGDYGNDSDSACNYWSGDSNSGSSSSSDSGGGGDSGGGDN